MVRVLVELKKILNFLWLGFPPDFFWARGNPNHEKLRNIFLGRMKTLSISKFENFLGARGNPNFAAKKAEIYY